MSAEASLRARVQKGLPSPAVVFAHNDLLASNIMATDPDGGMPAAGAEGGWEVLLRKLRPRRTASICRIPNNVFSKSAMPQMLCTGAEVEFGW